MRAIMDGVNLVRVPHPLSGVYGDPYNGCAVMRIGSATLRIIFTDHGGWDHVSVSMVDRCPTWAEMCAVKERFFLDEETVVQYHPAKSDYVNCHPFCLHLWRPKFGGIPAPDPQMVF